MLSFVMGGIHPLTLLYTLASRHPETQELSLNLFYPPQWRSYGNVHTPVTVAWQGGISVRADTLGIRHIRIPEPAHKLDYWYISFTCAAPTCLLPSSSHSQNNETLPAYLSLALSFSLSLSLRSEEHTV